MKKISLIILCVGSLIPAAGFAQKKPAKHAVAPPIEALNLSTKWANDRKAKPAMEDDGKVVFTYGQSSPMIICSPLYVCDIELEAGEVPTDAPHVGDKVNWNITPAISGEGEKRTYHVVIKPRNYNLETNAIIPTNRRTYYIRLRSLDSLHRQYVTRAGFYYPENAKKAWEAKIKIAARDRARTVSRLPGISPDHLNFHYQIFCTRGAQYFRPVRVFDDGRKVYIQMPRSYAHREAPSLLLIGRDKRAELVNYRVKDDYYIVDKLFSQAALVIGTGKGQRYVKIIRSCQKKNLFGQCVR